MASVGRAKVLKAITSMAKAQTAASMESENKMLTLFIASRSQVGLNFASLKFDL